LVTWILGFGLAIIAVTKIKLKKILFNLQHEHVKQLWCDLN